VLGLAALGLLGFGLALELLGLALPSPQERLLGLGQGALALLPQHLLDLAAGLLKLALEGVVVGARFGRAGEVAGGLLALGLGHRRQRARELPHLLRRSRRVARLQRARELPRGGRACVHRPTEGAQGLAVGRDVALPLGVEATLQRRDTPEGLVPIEPRRGHVVEQALHVGEHPPPLRRRRLGFERAHRLPKRAQVVVGQRRRRDGVGTRRRLGPHGRGLARHTNREQRDEQHRRRHRPERAHLRGPAPGQRRSDVEPRPVGRRVVEGGLHHGRTRRGRQGRKLHRHREPTVQAVVPVEHPRGVAGRHPRGHRGERARDGKERGESVPAQCHRGGQHAQLAQEHDGQREGQGPHREHEGPAQRAQQADAGLHRRDGTHLVGRLGHRGAV
jgi:hypothetical protein